jgi:hypothetical protein
LIPFPIMITVLIYLVLRYYPETTRLPQTLIFNPAFPYSSLHTFFLAASALIVAYFFARGFLSSGSLNLVTLGTGSLILGLGFLLGSILGNPPYGGSVQLVGITNSTQVCAGAFFGTFATLSLLNKAPRLGKRMLTVAGTYIGAILVVVLIALITEFKITPPFYVLGSGPTLFRREVLSAAFPLFSYSSIVLMNDYRASRASVLYWFSLGLASIAVQ